MMIGKICAAAGLLFAVSATTAMADTCQKADVIVYGGTPAGVTAAVQASRLKKSVILLEPTLHVGGMMANGLTKTDAAPRKNVYGGIAAGFLARAKSHYDTKDPVRINFESKWAEATFNNLLTGAKVNVIYGQRIAKATRVGATLTTLQMQSGRTFCGTAFVDASYEGDLMAASGAQTITGRESRSQYGESAAGVQKLGRPVANNKEILVDPYVIPGDRNSGLLPGVIDVGQKPLGSADQSLMAYNYRLCVTDTPTNRIPFSRPAAYDPLLYETAARFITGLEKDGHPIGNTYFIGSTITVRNKLDVNSTRFFSTNVWHKGYAYTTGDETMREEIRAYIRNYTQGLMWFGMTDPRVPQAVRDYMTGFGYCADEFTDNGGFPRQVYVRQARRLVGQYVLKQQDLMNKPAFPDSIGLGYYVMDEHGMIRTVQDGFIAEEVRAGISVGSYRIPYRAMLPKTNQVDNLIVPVGISASHAAFTSVRVEPTFMVLGQAAGAAAALAPGGKFSKLSVPKLQKALVAAGQVIK
jgi:hypothetical protein